MAAPPHLARRRGGRPGRRRPQRSAGEGKGYAGEGKGYDEEMARGGDRPAARLHGARDPAARCEAGHAPPPFGGAAVRGVWTSAGPPELRPAARGTSGACLPALPPGGVAAAPLAAPAAGAGRGATDRGRTDRPHRSAGVRPPARGEVHPALPVAPAGAGGGAPGAGVGLTTRPPGPVTGPGAGPDTCTGTDLVGVTLHRRCATWRVSMFSKASMFRRTTMFRRTMFRRTMTGAAKVATAARGGCGGSAAGAGSATPWRRGIPGSGG